MSEHKATLLTGPLVDYAGANWLRDSDVRRRLRQETAAMPRWRMQIAPDQGQILSLLVRLANTRLAIEIGTFTGYSALCIAEALPPDGKLIACDVSEEWTSIGRRYWQEAGIDGRIDLRIGPALTTLERLRRDGLDGKVDLVFIDADKTSYDAYYEHALALLRAGGLVLIDNVLWGGRVADPDRSDEDTDALRALNRKLHDDQRIDLALLPVGDGMTVARKR